MSEPHTLRARTKTGFQNVFCWDQTDHNRRCQPGANAILTRSSRANFVLIVLKSIQCSKSHCFPLWGTPTKIVLLLSTCTPNEVLSLTLIPVWFWCIHQDGPCGWNWNPPRRVSHQGRWLVPQGRTASCLERRHCSLDRRGRSGKNHFPSQCWWQEAAGRGRRFPRFPCEGFLGRGGDEINTLKALKRLFLNQLLTVDDGILHEHHKFSHILCILCFIWALTHKKHRIFYVIMIITEDFKLSFMGFMVIPVFIMLVCWMWPPGHFYFKDHNRNIS